MNEKVAKINRQIDFYHDLQKKYPLVAYVFDPVIKFLEKIKQEVINK